MWHNCVFIFIFIFLKQVLLTLKYCNMAFHFFLNLVLRNVSFEVLSEKIFQLVFFGAYINNPTVLRISQLFLKHFRTFLPHYMLCINMYIKIYIHFLYVYKNGAILSSSLSLFSNPCITLCLLCPSLNLGGN
jgi:hypothetical protein